MAKKPGDLPEGYRIPIYPNPQVRISVLVTESERNDLQRLTRRADGGVSGFVHELITQELKSQKHPWRWGWWKAKWYCYWVFPVGVLVGFGLPSGWQMGEGLSGYLIVGLFLQLVIDVCKDRQELRDILKR